MQLNAALEQTIQKNVHMSSCWKILAGVGSVQTAKDVIHRYEVQLSQSYLSVNTHPILIEPSGCCTVPMMQ